MAQQEQLSANANEVRDRIRDARATGQHPEMIPGYRPTKEVRQLIGDLFLCRVFPDLMPEYEPEDPNDPKIKIIEMTQALDEKIMNDPHRKQSPSKFLSYEVSGIKTKDDTYINLARHDSMGNLSVTVSNMLKETDIFPLRETEQFTLDSKGNFSVIVYRRSMPDSGSLPDEVATFKVDEPDFNEEVAKQYDHFYHLVKPYLIGH